MSVLNNSLLLGQEGGAGYVVERSLRFSSIDSGFCSRTFTSAGNRKTWTWAGWVKRGKMGYNNSSLFWCSTAETDTGTLQFRFGPSDRLDSLVVNGWLTNFRVTNAVFRDASAWYHIVLSFDSTQASDANRCKIYVNGVEQTFSTSSAFTQNADYGINQAASHNIGFGVDYFSGYLADIHFIDGQALTPSSFTEVDASTGQLVPKAYSGSFGTNGFWLKFSDNSAATATTLGKDYSGNNNNWTPNNLSVTAGAGNDSLTDTPTSYGTDTGAGGEVRGNYCTMNPLDTASGAPLTLTNGNLEHANPSTNWRWRRATFAMTTGKWYWEQTVTTGATGSAGYLAGAATAAFDFNAGTAGLYARQSGTQYNNGTTTNSVFASTTAGDILGFAFDADAGKLWVSQNGTFVGSPTAGTGNSWSNVPSGVFPLFAAYNVAGNIMNFGARSFAYTAPSGFKALCDTNLPAPVVAKSSDYFQTLLYTGNGGSKTVSGLSFSPDLVWIKGRSVGYGHRVFDTVRGTGTLLYTNLADAAVSQPNANDNFASFDSGGFSLGAGIGLNENNATYVAWAFDAGNTTTTNTAGSITSQVRANASAGFSIITAVQPVTANLGCTVGHGLGVAPAMYIVKDRDLSINWGVYHAGLSSPATQALQLSTTSAAFTATNYWKSTSPTSTVLSIGTSIVGEGNDFVVYAFAPVAGYSSAFSYTGNGASGYPNADGPYIHLGFRPRLILIKCSSAVENWVLYDTARSDYNYADDQLYPNLSNAEATGANREIDILSNGFKVRSNGGIVNTNAATYIGFAWAESPFQYARAR